MAITALTLRLIAVVQESSADPADEVVGSGGVVLLVGFLIVGIGAAVIAARLAKKDRAE